MKGLTREQVQKVMAVIKLEGYRKRIRQSKRIFIIGLVIAIVGGIAWIFLINAGIYNRGDQYLERTNARMFIGITGVAFFGGLGQLIYGIVRFVSYTAKLKKAAKYI